MGDSLSFSPPSDGHFKIQKKHEASITGKICLSYSLYLFYSPYPFRTRFFTISTERDVECESTELICDETMQFKEMSHVSHLCFTTIFGLSLYFVSVSCSFLWFLVLNEPLIIASILHSMGDVNADETVDARDELAQLDALMTQRFDLKRKINQFHSPIIRQLPPDVTSTIFEFCLPDFEDFPLRSLQELPDPPLSLGAICTYWREIAWSTPTLWSSLVVSVIPSKRDLQATIVQEWLARSGQLPLSIRIRVYPDTAEACEPAVAVLADSLNQYSTRWSDFGILMPQILYRYFHATYAPNLKSIRLYSRDDRNDSRTDFHINCPHLQRAWLSFCSPSIINIQWDNLTHLYLESMRLHDCLLILRKTLPQLVFLSFNSIGGMELAEESVVTSLRSLRVDRIGSSETILLNTLLCPHMAELSLGPWYSDFAPFISLVERSSCSLQIFTFYLFDFERATDANLMRMLQVTPSVKKLSIIAYGQCTLAESGRWNISELVAKVLWSQEANCQSRFLPKLEILEYTGQLWDHLPPGDLPFLPPPTDSAEQGSLRLIKLDLYQARRIPVDIFSFFMNLIKRGITVDIRSQSRDILQGSIDYYANKERQDWVEDLDLGLMLDLA